jgi:hypothetical protein
MNQESLAHNPFMMMLSPETVIAAMERSEKLGRLNRRMCHPLDRPAVPGAEQDEPARNEGAAMSPRDD